MDGISQRGCKINLIVHKMIIRKRRNHISALQNYVRPTNRHYLTVRDHRQKVWEPLVCIIFDNGAQVALYSAYITWHVINILKAPQAFQHIFKKTTKHRAFGKSTRIYAESNPTGKHKPVIHTTDPAQCTTNPLCRQQSHRIIPSWGIHNLKMWNISLWTASR